MATTDDAPESNYPGSTRRPCPSCGGPMSRVRRSAIDRLASLLTPRQRYRCASIQCGWEGSLRVDEVRHKRIWRI